MRPESGVNLVSGALQSSLARAQKNYQFHGDKSLYNSEEKQQLRKDKNLGKKLKDYCETIGSNFASYSAKQLLDYGNSLDFEEGGLLEPGISEELKQKYTVLTQNAWPPIGGIEAAFASYSRNKNKNNKTATKKVLCDTTSSIKKSNSEPVATGLLRGKQNVVKLQEVNKKVAGKFDKSLEKVLNLLKDKTIGKGKRKRLVKKLKNLQNLKNKLESTTLEPPVKNQTVENPQIFKDTRKNKLSNIATNLINLPYNFKKHSTDAGPSGVQVNKLKQFKGMGPDADRNGDTSTMSNGSSTTTNHQLPEPKRVLFPKEKIVLGWRQKQGPGGGFHNFGNTCYLNSSLQALFHIPAFVNWLLTEEEHRKNCTGILPNQSPCIICVVYVTLQEHLKSSSAIRPRVLDKLRAICKHFSYGRQEDAHEFLRYLLEGMERSYLTAINGLRLDNRTKETNPLGQIFGGYIRTEVTCVKCHFISTTFQPSAELQLDIRHITTLEDALQQHFRKERLDNNDYKCEKCRTISQATKQFSLELPPIVLCLQLKRFTLYGNKISKRIHCNKYLNMSRYLHKSRKDTTFREQELKYRLVGLVTHMGQSPNCGHYTAIAEGSNGMYYQFDDQFVYQVSQQTALNNDAYVIIYEMDKPSRPNNNNNASETSVHEASYSSSTPIKSNVSSPGGAQKKFTIPFAKSNSNGNGTSALRNSVMSTTSDTSPKTNGTAGSAIDRKIISFGLQKPLTNGTIKSATTPQKINILKPGVALTNSSKIFPSSSTTTVAKTDTAVVTKASNLKLVPYNDVENDDSDEKEDQSQVVVKCETEKKQDQNLAEVESKKKIIGPIFQQLPTANQPKMAKTTSGIASSHSLHTKSPEKTYGVKRKLDEILGPAKPSSNDKLSPEKKEKLVLNATSKWTISSTPKKISNGYSSDPDCASKKSKTQASSFSRAKSMERVSTKDKSVLNAKPSLIPNKNNITAQPITDNSTKVKDSTVITNGLPKSEKPAAAVVLNGHHSPPSSAGVKKRKRSRSRSLSSSSSSDSDSKKRRKKESKKKKNKKEKRKVRSSSTSSSDSDNSSDNSSVHRRKLKHKKKKHHSKSRDNSEESKSSKKSDSKNRRETESEERDRILRQARNPSRSPGPIRSSVDCNVDTKHEKFHPSKINGREKSIVGWNNEPSALSKSIEQDRRRQLEKSKDDLFDEELDQGRVKKHRKSISPSREMDMETNKFQSLQDKKVAVDKWSTILDGYDKGFKDHKTSPGGKKPWKASRRDDFRSTDKDDGARSHSSSYPSSSSHRPGYREYRHHNHYDKDNYWHKDKHRNHR